MNDNTDRIIAQLHARALRKEKTANLQPSRFSEFADSCKMESEFLYKVIDCMEALQATIFDMRKEQVNANKYPRNS